MYVFAGYFVLHGWIASGKFIWIPFFACFVAVRYLNSHDIFAMIPPRWHWAVVTFRLVARWNGNWYGSVARPSVEYVCPLNYLLGTSAIFGFRSLSLPTGVSKIITFFGTKIFVLHWLDMLHVGYGGELFGLLRIPERRITPRSMFDNSLLTSAQWAARGALLEIYRDRLFQFIFNRGALVDCYPPGSTGPHKLGGFERTLDYFDAIESKEIPKSHISGEKCHIDLCGILRRLRSMVYPENDEPIDTMPFSILISHDSALSLSPD
jgi:hypothetical protein